MYPIRTPVDKVIPDLGWVFQKSKPHLKIGSNFGPFRVRLALPVPGGSGHWQSQSHPNTGRFPTLEWSWRPRRGPSRRPNGWALAFCRRIPPELGRVDHVDPHRDPGGTRDVTPACSRPHRRRLARLDRPRRGAEARNPAPGARDHLGRQLVRRGRRRRTASAYWVQNGADEIEVTPDGTVFAGVDWDEAGRCAGLYKDGKVNRVLLKERDGKGQETAWGWGTANNAVAAGGELLYVANAGKKLLRFRWTPGDLDSARFVDEVDTERRGGRPGRPGRRVVVVYKDAVEVRAGDRPGAGPAGSALDGATRRGHRRPTAASGSSAGGAIRHLSAEGKDLEREPCRAWTSRRPWPSTTKGRLLVCDDGRRQQVLIFDVAAAPKLVATFGDEGGLRSGTPGRVAPRKLFALQGAGTDAAGNLYVAMGFGTGPVGQPGPPLVHARGRAPLGADLRGVRRHLRLRPRLRRLRRLRPDADLRPRPVQAEPGTRLEPPGHHPRPAWPDPEDDRLKHGCSVLLRNLEGRRLLYTIGQYGGGYRLLHLRRARRPGRPRRPAASRPRARPGPGTSTPTATSGTATPRAGPSAATPSGAGRPTAKPDLRPRPPQDLALARRLRARPPGHLRAGHRLALPVRLPQGPGDRVVGRRRPDARRTTAGWPASRPSAGRSATCR